MSIDEARAVPRVDGDDGELVGELLDEAQAHSGSSIRNGCADCGMSTNLLERAADRITALSAEVERAAAVERQRIIRLLIDEGITRDQSEDGWWETSTGVEFGQPVIDRIAALGAKP